MRAITKLLCASVRGPKAAPRQVPWERPTHNNLDPRRVMQYTNDRGPQKQLTLSTKNLSHITENKKNMTTEIKIIITYAKQTNTRNKYITSRVETKLPSPERWHQNTCQHKDEYDTAHTLERSDNANMAPAKAIVLEAKKK